MKNNILLYIIGGIVLLIIIFRKKINKTVMFDILIAKILLHEGGYVNDPDDAGGETKYGITKARYPNLDIKNLTPMQAIAIYKKDFYIPMKIEEIDDINLAMQYFDMGVNAGISNAKAILDNSVEVQNSEPLRSIVDIYKQLRIEYYTKIATYRNNKKYLAGWINRVNSSNIV